MPREKPLGDRREFYSNKRKAVIDVIEWQKKGMDEDDMLFNLTTKYGFGQRMLHDTLYLINNRRRKLKEKQKKSEEKKE